MLVVGIGEFMIKFENDGKKYDWKIHKSTIMMTKKSKNLTQTKKNNCVHVKHDRVLRIEL